MHLQIKHHTRFTYSRPVALDPHILRMTPRSDNSLVILENTIELNPVPAGCTNFLDLEGNSVRQIWFDQLTSELEIRLNMEVKTLRSNPFDYVLTDAGSAALPATYTPPHHQHLAPYLHTTLPANALGSYLEPILAECEFRTIPFLSHLTSEMYQDFQPEIRLHGPPRSPDDTMQLRKGTCRDLTVLFIELCRHCGLAARFVSGYWSGVECDGKYHLHAWAEVYLPEGGWRGYDPSIGLAIADLHVPLAASAFPAGAAAISGTFWGTDVKSEMEADISVERVRRTTTS